MNIEVLLTEFAIKGLRSSGPGGQHVNKTSSKIEISFNLESSQAFSEPEKDRLREKLSSRLSLEGNLVLQCSETRSQHRNRAMAVEKMLELLDKNLKVPKKRRKTKPSKAAMERRLKIKKLHGLKKSQRHPPNIE